MYLWIFNSLFSIKFHRPSTVKENKNKCWYFKAFQKLCILGEDQCYMIPICIFCFTHMLSHCRQMDSHNITINHISKYETLCLYKGKKLKNLLRIRLIRLIFIWTGLIGKHGKIWHSKRTSSTEHSSSSNPSSNIT